MALEREHIEKRDFPIGRRGYDPDAVDRHLRAIAAEFEELRAQAGRGSDSVAVAASERVQAIVAAAEASASQIQREADDVAERTREDAAQQAREHVAQVSEATAGLLQRVDALEAELGTLLESLRTGANRLNADLALLQVSVGELRAASAGGDEVAVVEEALAEDAALEAQPEPEPVEEKEPTVEEKEPTVEEKEPTVEEKEPTVEAPSADGDSEGARLIALNMALNGTPRDETDRYLAENFEIPDRQALLDEVYARVG